MTCNEVQAVPSSTAYIVALYILSVTYWDSLSKACDVVTSPLTASTVIQPAGSSPFMYLKQTRYNFSLCHVECCRPVMYIPRDLHNAARAADVGVFSHKHPQIMSSLDVFCYGNLFLSFGEDRRLVDIIHRHRHPPGEALCHSRATRTSTFCSDYFPETSGSATHHFA